MLGDARLLNRYKGPQCINSACHQWLHRDAYLRLPMEAVGRVEKVNTLAREKPIVVGAWQPRDRVEVTVLAWDNLLKLTS